MGGLLARSLAGAVAVSAWCAPLAAQSTPLNTRPVVHGVVWDSIAGAPLAGADVQLALRSGAAAPQATVSDSTGHFRIVAQGRGEYVLGFYHPALDVLGLEGTARVVTLADDTDADVTLAVPAAATVRQLRCGEEAGAPTKGLLVGTLRYAGARSPRALPAITAEWGALQVDAAKLSMVTLRAGGSVDGAGNYQICGIPVDAPVTVRVSGESARAILGDVEMPASGFVRHDLVLADTGVARGALALSARVTRKDGTPVMSGRAYVGELGRAVPVVEGQFTMSGVPEGTWRVDVQSMGLDPLSALITVAPGLPAGSLVMAEFPQPLDAVTVVGTVQRAGGILDDVRRRSRVASGTIFFAGAPALKSALEVADVLKEARGFRWVSDTEAYGRPHPGIKCDGLATYLNGMLLGFNADGLDALRNSARPADVLAVETFPDAMFMPEQWRMGRTCSAMVVWTKY